MPESITISINSLQGSKYNYSLIHNNDNPIIKDRILSPEDSKFLHQITTELKGIFSNHNPKMSHERQQYVGHQLFTIWFGDHWNAIQNQIGKAEQVHINIISKDSLTLNLPWELMTPEGSNYLGIDTRYCIRRYPGEIPSLASPRSTLRAGPLRILFMACSPDDNAQLFYEKEEEYLQKAISGLDTAYDSGDMGTFQELKERVCEFNPHIVHLSGHGIIRDNCVGCFAFEDENGKEDLKSSDEICRILSGQGVHCVFVSGCYSGEAPADDVLMGICQNLVTGGIPYAVGWAASIADIHATDFVKEFYTFLASGRSIDQALNQGRWNLWNTQKQVEDLSWILPVLYSSSLESHLYDTHKPREEPQRNLKPIFALPDMKEGYARHFVGRRRKIQEMLPTLGSGELSVVILTGLGGSGKSSLATKVARKLEDQDHFTPLPIPCSRERLLSGELILEIVGAAFGSPDDEPLFRTDRSLSYKIKYIFNILNKRKFILVLDNLETNLDESNTITDPGVAEFYTILLSNLSGKSRAIITSRYLPANVISLPKTVREIPLGDLHSSDVTKILRSNEIFERLYWAGKIPVGLLSDIHLVFGGVPRFIEQIVSLISVDPEQFQRDLKTVTHPVTYDSNRLRKIRNDYYNSLVLDRLFALLSEESKDALCRSAVYSVAVSPEGIAAVTGISQDSISKYLKEWQSRAFVYPERIPGFLEIWTVYGMLRPWLLNHLDEDKKIVTCNSAGDFLCSLVKEGREKEIGIPCTTCLLKARSLFIEINNLEKARQVTSIVSGFYRKRGRFDLIRTLNSELVDREPHPEPMGWIGIADMDQGKYESAKTLLVQVLEIRREIGDQAGIAVTLHQLATISMKQGEYESAKNLFKKTLSIHQNIGDQAGIAVTLHQLATIDMEQGEYESATTLFNQALNINQEIGNKAEIAVTLHQLATIDLNKGEYESAKTLFNQALGIRRDIGDMVGIASTLHNLASIELEQGEYESAKILFTQALDIRQKNGNITEQAAIFHSFATIDLNKGEYESATTLLKQALDIFRKIGDKARIAATLHQLANIDLNKGEYESATTLFNQALDIRREIGNMKGEAATLHGLASIDLNKGEYESAKALFIQALDIHQKIENKPGIAATLHNIASIDIEQGEYESATTLFNQALDIRREIGDKPGIAVTLHQLGSIAINQGDYDSATTLFNQALDIHRDVEDKVGIAVTLHQLGSIALNKGEYDSAKILLNQALDINREKVDKAGIANSLHQLASIEMNQGEYESAKALFIQVLDIRREIGDEAGLAVALHQLADIDLNQEEYESAKRLFIQALVKYDDLGSSGGIAYELINLGILARKTGLVGGTIELVGLAYTICRSIGHPKTNEALSMFQDLVSKTPYSEEQVNKILEETVKKYQTGGIVAFIESIFTN